MRLSTRGRFAITAMIDLALRQSNTPVPLQDLAVRHRISMSYLEQMFAKLRQHALVDPAVVTRWHVQHTASRSLTSLVPLKTTLTHAAKMRRVKPRPVPRK